MPGTLITVVDFATKNILPLGSDGEIVIKTPSLFKGYWHSPQDDQGLLRIAGFSREMSAR